MEASKKVVLNTGILYFRMLITMGISLFSTRLVIQALGAIDYGIFNLIAGVILMLSFLNAAMATSTQRYLSFYQGRNDIEKQKEIFINSLVLHIAIGVILVCLLELFGMFLFNGFLNIPIDRINSAKTIYHFMSATVFFTIIAVPFNGSLVAHENMLWIAIVNIIESFLKLAIAFLLFYIASDKLITFGLLTAGISIVSFVLYASYCYIKYTECSFRSLFLVNKIAMKELGFFAGWNLFGALCSVGRNQGTAVVLNLFFGVIINAAYAIANQINSQLNFFSASMVRALSPQIMKSEGVGDRKRMLRLSMLASKFSFFLLAFLAIPCIFEMPALLKVWLNLVPENTVVFATLILISNLLSQLTVGLQTAVQATGKIRLYQSVVGTIIIFSPVLGYFALEIGLPSYYVIISIITLELVAAIFRLFFLRAIAGLSIREYCNRVFFRLLIPLFTTLIVCSISINLMDIPFRFLITGISSACFFGLSIYFFGLCKDEKELIDKFLIKIKLKYDKAFS